MSPAATAAGSATMGSSAAAVAVAPIEWSAAAVDVAPIKTAASLAATAAVGSNKASPSAGSLTQRTCMGTGVQPYLEVSCRALQGLHEHV